MGKDATLDINIRKNVEGENWKGEEERKVKWKINKTQEKEPSGTGKEGKILIVYGEFPWLLETILRENK